MRSMKKHLIKFATHPLISGSGIIFAGSFLVNIINYVFNLIMGRILSVSDYGLLISLIALVSLLTLFQGSLTTLFAKFAAKYAVHKDYGSEIGFIKFSSKIILFIAIGFLIGLIVLMYPISGFLHVSNYFLMVLVFLTVFVSILGSLPSGILQGHLKFRYLSGISVLGAVIKLAIGILLVMGGLGVIGGIVGVLAFFVIPYIVSSLYVFYYTKKHAAEKKSVHIDFISEFKKASGPFLIASIAITILQASDVIFARHFFSNVMAGQYAALSLMGKAIFYITSPIYFVFFPLIAHKAEKKEDTTGTLFLASVIIFACSGLFTAIYFIYPQIILNIFFPSAGYSVLRAYLGFYSLYILIFSICYLLFNYFLSVGETRIYKITVSVALIYIISLILFHKTIADFIMVLTFSSLLLLFLLCIYYKLRR